MPTLFSVRDAPLPAAVLLPAGGHRLPRLRHTLPRLLRVVRGEGQEVAPGESSVLLTLGNNPSMRRMYDGDRVIVGLIFHKIDAH